MKWFSSRTNPAARYFPQVFSVEEQELTYRCLGFVADKGTENRATSSGSRDFQSDDGLFKPEQEAVLKALETIADSLSQRDKEFAINSRIENNRLIRKKKSFSWLPDKQLTDIEFTKWWKSTLRLSATKRKSEVAKFRTTHITSRPRGVRVKSALCGAYSRDAQNQWSRRSVEREHQFSRVLPIIQRIDAAFQKALPERWALQKEFCESLDPRFVIGETSFTTLTVNKNWRTEAHRDSGDLSQGFSNIAVFSNGRKFSGGHLVLPEFNTEICLKPGDLLFVANHEYIHQNTAIKLDDPEAERLSIVAYAREDFAYSGTVEYENHRAQFQKQKKKFSNMWASAAWYSYLKKQLPKANSFVDQLRAAKCLNRETVLLHWRYEHDPLWLGKKWEFVGAMPLSSHEDYDTLKTLFSCAHFRRPRQDVWLVDNKNEEGAEFVDSIYLEDGWGYAYAESSSGNVKFNNNRFNVQGIGKLKNFTLPIHKFSRQAFEWMAEKWEQSLNDSKPVVVCLIRVPTGIPEAPYRYGLTTLSRIQAHTYLTSFQKDKTKRHQFYATSGTLGIQDQFSKFASNDFLMDLGAAYHKKIGGVLTTDGDASCDAISVRSPTQLEYLKQTLSHWRKRAKNFGSDDYKSRYVRVGHYKIGNLRLPLTQVRTEQKFIPSAARPWHWDVSPTRVTLKHYGWQPKRENINKKVRAKTYSVTLEARGSVTEESWSSRYQSPLLLAADVPPMATLSIWRLQNSRWNNAQAILTNGESFWLFQSLSTVAAIRRGTEYERDRRETRKVTTSSIVSHLQRSEIQIKEDNSRLLNWLQTNPAFIPTPFTEMAQSLRQEYESPYRKGRANVIAIGGPPASGKTTLMKKLLQRTDDWESQKLKYQPLSKIGAAINVPVPCYWSKKLNTWIFGVYDDSRGTFQGTDATHKMFPQALELFIKEKAGESVNILFEGSNVVRPSTLVAISKSDVNLVILRLMVSKELKQSRHKARNDKQSEGFKQAKETQIRNVESDERLFDAIVQVRNETEADQQRIVKMVDWFTRRATPAPLKKSTDDQTPWEPMLWGKELSKRDRAIRSVSRAQFKAAITDDKEDNFSKTFLARADSQNLWKLGCVGIWKGNDLCAAVITRMPSQKSDPSVRTANLTLLHTFAKHRGKGYGRTLTQDAINQSLLSGARYFRVSSEPESVDFYRKLGFKFLGKQKSGSLASMFRLNGNNPHNGSYDWSDSVIASQLMTRRRGSVIEKWATAR